MPRTEEVGKHTSARMGYISPILGWTQMGVWTVCLQAHALPHPVEHCASSVAPLVPW